MGLSEHKQKPKHTTDKTMEDYEFNSDSDDDASNVDLMETTDEEEDLDGDAEEVLQSGTVVDEDSDDEDMKMDLKPAAKEKQKKKPAASRFTAKSSSSSATSSLGAVPLPVRPKPKPSARPDVVDVSGFTMGKLFKTR